MANFYHEFYLLEIILYFWLDKNNKIKILKLNLEFPSYLMQFLWTLLISEQAFPKFEQISYQAFPGII